MPARRALLIGIDAYPHVPPLDGCVNDVDLMREVLTGAFGFDVAHITRLVNGQATRDGILGAFDALVAATGTDDIVVVHYAGHGSQMRDREGDEPSGFDSTIVPVDSGRAPVANRDITDDEIHLRLEALGRKTSFITLVFDSCHSGTITRDAFGAKVRAVEPDLRPVAELPPSPIPAGTRPRTRSGSSAWMPLGDTYVLISGCRDDERSYEYRPPEGDGAVAHGALTYFLCRELRQAASGATYRDVFERVAARVTAENGEQHPQMEGRADREVFGVADISPGAFVRVVDRVGDDVVLAAGAAHGVTVGSTYDIHPQGTKEPAGAPPIGEVAVTDVGAVTSTARVTSEDVPGTVGPEARAFETTHAFGDFRLRVHVMGTAGTSAAMDDLLRLLGVSRRISLVGDAAAAAACVHLLPARPEAALPVPQAGGLGAPMWAVVGGTGDLLVPLKPPGDEQAVVDNLELVATCRQVLATENPDPRSRLRGRFSLDLLRRHADGSWSVAEPEEAGGRIVFEEGEAIAFRIASRHDDRVFAALVDVGVSGRVSVVRQAEVLGPGVSYDIGGAGDLELGFPEGFPFVDTADHLREAEGVETLKLFITSSSTDFTSIEQGGVKRSAASPLESLLRGAMHGRATRDIVSAPIGGEDWTTVSRAFVLRRRTSAPLEAGRPVSLAGATLTANGVSGTASAAIGKAARAEAQGLLTAELQRALSQAGFIPAATLEVSGARPGGLTRDAAPSLELQVPAPPNGYGQLVMAVDEFGVVTWCLPKAPARGRETAATQTFVIPTDAPGGAPKAGTRGLIDTLGKKVLKALVFPLIDPLLGEVGSALVNQTERRLTPYRVRTFTPDDYASSEAGEIDADTWTRLGKGRALLMIHGTFSRSHLAFQQWPKADVEAMHRLYGGRVFAFDHFTLSHDPKENVRRLVAAMPDTADLTLDIVCHSRGGLVSRVLGEKQAELSLGARRIGIGKVVFVGVPSAGTELADPANLTRAADVVTNLLNFLPDNGITEPLTLVFSLLKQLAVGTFKGLDGLQSMHPSGDFVRWLNAGGRAGNTEYYAVASNVTPAEPGLRRLAVRYGLNQLFHGGNDFVVPADGVYVANGSGYFPIGEKLVLEGDDAAAHTAYFRDPRVRRQILQWLGAA